MRIVGEAFFTQGEGMELLTPTSTLADWDSMQNPAGTT